MSNDEIYMEEEKIQLHDDDQGLNLEDFEQGNFVKDPNVGDTIVFKILKVYNNLNTKAVNTKTGKEFDVGLKQKDGKIKRIDIDTDLGVYTISTWEIFFKLLSTKEPIGELTKYAKKHDKRFNGAKISITRLESGIHANYKLEDLAKIIGKSLDETKIYQERVQKAMSEKRLFDVKLID